MAEQLGGMRIYFVWSTSEGTGSYILQYCTPAVDNESKQKTNTVKNRQIENNNS